MLLPIDYRKLDAYLLWAWKTPEAKPGTKEKQPSSLPVQLDQSRTKLEGDVISRTPVGSFLSLHELNDIDTDSTYLYADNTYFVVRRNVRLLVITDCKEIKAVFPPNVFFLKIL